MILLDWAADFRKVTGDVLDGTTNETLYLFLADAIVIHDRFVKDRVRTDEERRKELTFAAKSYEMALPTDFDRSFGINIYLNETDTYPIPTDLYQISFGKINFNKEYAVGDSIFIDYTPKPKVRSLFVKTYDCVELDDPKTMILLEGEVKKMVIAVDDGFESSNATDTITNQNNALQE